MATLEPRGDSYRVYWRIHGEKAVQSCTFSGDAKTALKMAKLALSIAEARNHKITRAEMYDLVLGPEDDPNAGIPTLAEWADTWLTRRAAMPDIQSDVVRSYRMILKARVLPFLGHLHLTEINEDRLREWVAWIAQSRITVGSRNKRLGDRLVSPTTIRRAHSILHACLGAAVPKWLPANPASVPAGKGKNVLGLPKRQRFEAAFLTADQIHLLLDHCDPHIRDMVDVAVNSGLRLGELVALKVKAVVFNSDGYATIKVLQSLKNDGTIGPPKSEASRRDVVMCAETSRLLRQLCEGRPLGAFVFQSPLGGRWDVSNFRHRYWDPTVAAAQRCPDHPPPAPEKPRRGPRRALRPDEVSTCSCPSRLHCKPRFHDLRHTHASICITEGMHARKIQARLGHASYTITMDIYGHLMETGTRDEVDRLGAHLARPRAAPVTAPRRVAGSVARRARNARAGRVPVQRRASARSAASGR